MAKSKKSGYRIDANYTEDAVAMAMESFFAILTAPHLRFSIEPFSRQKERLLGADVRFYDELRQFKPFYMQFKRPSAFPDSSSSKIIKDRKNEKLAVSPRSLFFSLREKAKGHQDYQHNILFRLRRVLKRLDFGDAAYVCPLFLDRTMYSAMSRQAAYDFWSRGFHDPWFWSRIEIRDGNGIIRFDQIPAIREHISIPPHALVSDAKHHYSFTESGQEICFHSPLSLPEGGMLLSRWLKQMSSEFVHSEKKYIADFRKEYFWEILKELDDLIPKDQIDTSSEMMGWLTLGDVLEREYGIAQYAFVSW